MYVSLNLIEKKDAVIKKGWEKLEKGTDYTFQCRKKSGKPNIK